MFQFPIIVRSPVPGGTPVSGEFKTGIEIVETHVPNGFISAGSSRNMSPLQIDLPITVNFPGSEQRTPSRGPLPLVATSGVPQILGSGVAGGSSRPQSRSSGMTVGAPLVPGKKVSLQHDFQPAHIQGRRPPIDTESRSCSTDI